MTILRNIPALIELYKIFSPIISKPCLPLYSDNLSNPGSGWPTTDSGNYVYEYKDGEYRILVCPIQTESLSHSGSQASDYKVSTLTAYLVFGERCPSLSQAAMLSRTTSGCSRLIHSGRFIRELLQSASNKAVISRQRESYPAFPGN